MYKSTKCELERALILAVEHRDYPAVERLIQEGVNPNARKMDRVTPLHIAAERGDVKMAEILLKAKSLNLNPFTIHGYTPLILALNSRQTDFVKFILEHGADVNMPERFGKTAIHHAAYSDSIPMAKILTDHGANLNKMDVFFHTPLSIAIVEKHHLAMAKFLVEHGADINLNRGICGLVLQLFLEACLACCDHKTLDIVIYLLDRGIDPNTRDALTDRNALHYFAINNYVPLAELLISRGTDPNHKDYYDLRPSDLAKQQYNMEAAEYLDEVLAANMRSTFEANSRAESQTEITKLPEHIL